MIRNRKKWVLAGFCVMTASAIVFGACGSANASSAARGANATARQVDTVMEAMAPVDESRFKFPAAFGNEFFAQGEQTDAARPVDTRRATRYRNRHFETERLNQNNEARSQYLDKFDDLYVLCADVTAANNKINERVGEIKAANAEMKRLAEGLRKQRGAGTTDEFTRIEAKSDETRKELKQLYKERRSIDRELKAIPNTGDNLNVESTTARYNAVMEKLNARLARLDTVKADLDTINASMAGALGETVAEPMQKAARVRQRRTERIDRSDVTRERYERLPRGERPQTLPHQLPQGNPA